MNIVRLSIRQVYGVISAQIPLGNNESQAGALLEELDAIDGGLIDIDQQFPTLSEFRAQLRQALGENMPFNRPP